MKKQYNCRESRGLTTVKPPTAKWNSCTESTHASLGSFQRNFLVDCSNYSSAVTICAHKTKEAHMISGTSMQFYWKMQL